ncbi:MAG: hypothetical protein K6T68_11735, partial [Alicyclobacillus shizuokensis]|nr:hypothetical protein [Alicyclobacillus shizuokensis]
MADATKVGCTLRLLTDFGARPSPYHSWQKAGKGEGVRGMALHPPSAGAIVLIIVALLVLIALWIIVRASD